MINNRITLQGNLTKDPEYKTISDRSLVTFRIAVNEYLGRDKEETVYMDIDCWGAHADYAENVQLAKGDRVNVDGRLRQRSFPGKDGGQRTAYSVVPVKFSKVVKPPRRASSNAAPAPAPVAETSDDQVTF